MVKDVDLKDLIFVALCLEKNCVLWTGDKKLIKGLERVGYHNIVTTSMLYIKYINE
jgi:predicted nucleic acid-binding protein